METQNTSNKKLGITIGAIVVIVIAAVVFAMSRGSEDAVQNTPVTETVPATSSPVTQIPPVDVPKQPGTSASAYKDGTYTAIGSYMSPGGPDKISVTLTLADDVVTAASVTPMPGDGTSRQYQNMFVSGYQQFVIGKDIATLNLTRVSGSSLTPIGFDNALAQIKAQSKA